jgi:UDP-N-acetyl-D-glucosamine dehydrogenase
LAGQINRGMPYYVVNRLMEAMNSKGRSIQGSRILVVGVAYKPGIPDDRESPSYEIMDLIRDKGGIIDYHDPFVPEITEHSGGKEWAGHQSIPWSPESLSLYDAAVVCTPHHGINYGQLAELIPLIIDACNIVPKNRIARVIPA